MRESRQEANVLSQATPLQRRLLGSAAALFLGGLLTGVWAGVVITEGRALLGMHLLGPPGPLQVKLTLTAHLNALLGCFWMVAVALTLELTRFEARGKTWLARLVTVVNYANWLVTLGGSFWSVKGLEFTLKEAPNDVMAAFLMALVVLPGLAAAGLWTWGLVGPARES